MSAPPPCTSGPPYSGRSRVINHQFPKSSQVNYIFTQTLLVNVQKEILTSTHNIKVMKPVFLYDFDTSCLVRVGKTVISNKLAQLEKIPVTSRFTRALLLEVYIYANSVCILYQSDPITAFYYSIN